MSRRSQCAIGSVAVALVAAAGQAVWAGGVLSSMRPPRAVSDEEYYQLDALPARRAAGALRRVQEQARHMLLPGRAQVWGFEGTLGPRDLTNAFFTFGPRGIEGFNVLDAEGFVDTWKCNLFVFELLYRSGIVVPVRGRSRGWGYLGPAEVIRDVDEGEIEGDWAVIADDYELETLQRSLAQGIPFLVVGEGRGGRSGHMGIVDRVHRIRHDRIGRILRVDYTGWEANGDGAHYRRRVWSVERFTAIHVLELREPAPDEPQVVALGEPGQASELDAPRFARSLRGPATGAPSEASAGEPVWLVRLRSPSTADAVALCRAGSTADEDRVLALLGHDMSDGARCSQGLLERDVLGRAAATFPAGVTLVVEPSRAHLSGEPSADEPERAQPGIDERRLRRRGPAPLLTQLLDGELRMSARARAVLRAP